MTYNYENLVNYNILRFKYLISFDITKKAKKDTND